MPQELLKFLSDDRKNLHDDLKDNLKFFRNGITANSFTKNGPWEGLFGKNPHTDELFMAYHYALYLNSVAEAGRKSIPSRFTRMCGLNFAGEDRDESFPVVAGGGDHPGELPFWWGSQQCSGHLAEICPGSRLYRPGYSSNRLYQHMKEISSPEPTTIHSRTTSR